MELQVVLPRLFARLPGLRLAAEPRYRTTAVIYGLESLSGDLVTRRLRP
ncbi:hypothetical protein [Pseudonocardia sp. NPDC049154]